MVPTLRTLGLLLLLLAVGRGMGQELVLRNLDEENGLPSNCVLDLFVDSENMLWVGTNKGLYRYDGFDFERIGAGTALDDVNVVAMYEDRQRQQMILSAYGERLFAWRKGLLREILPEQGQLGASLGGCIGQFVPLESGLLRATHTQFPSTYLIDLERCTVRPTRHRRTQLAGSVEEKDGLLLTTCLPHHAQGRLRDSIHIGAVDTVVSIGVSAPGRALTSPTAGHLPGGGAYFHHYLTLVTMDPEGQWHRVDLADNILGVFADERNHLWVRVEGFGLQCFDDRLHPLPVSAPSLEGTNVSDCVRDDQGGFWFSTVDRGLFYCASPDVFTYNAQRDYHTAWTSALVQLDTCTVLVGTADGQIHRSTVEYGSHLEASNEALRSRGELKTIELFGDTVVPGTMRVLWSISQSRALPVPQRDARWGSIHDAQPIDGERTLLASVGGLRLADARVPDSLALLHTKARCYRIVPGTSPGTWCVACQDGLHRYGPNGLQRYAEQDTLLRTSIRDLLRHGDTLWLATHKGIMLHTSRGTRRMALPGTTPYPECRAFAEGTNGSLWLATLDGLFHIVPGRGAPTITRYGRAQGLPSDAHYDVVRTGRWIWSISGPDVCFFDPGTMRTPDPSTPLRVVEVSGWAGDHMLGTGSSFEQAVDHVRLALRGVNHARFTRDAFRYRLDHSGPWVHARGPVVDLLGLRPGSYLAEVQAADAIGGWSESLLVPWTIHPAWWQRTAVRMGAVVLLMMLLGSGLWYYRERRQRERLLASEVQRYHHKALIAQMEPHFLFNALASIQGFVARGDVDASTRYLAKFAKLMRGLLQAAHDEVVTLHDEIAVLDNYCALEALRATPTFAYSIDVHPSIDASATTIPSLLVQPYVENAVRHGLRNLNGERTGLLRVRFEPEGDDTLRCTVEDNGVGRVTAATLAHQGHGWRSMGTRINAERFRLMGEVLGAHTVGVTTEDLGNGADRIPGTRVTLRLPILPTDKQQRTTEHRDDEGRYRG